MIRARFSVVVLAAACVTARAHPHRYVDQQAMVSVGLHAVEVTIRIVPSFVEGAAIFAGIDSDGNGLVSDDEALAFGAAVLGKSRLEIDGRKVPWSTVAATVPAGYVVASGSGVIEVELSAPCDLDGGEGHRIDFEIAYDDLSHDWFVQPYFYENVVEATASQVVERSDDGHRVGIRLGADAS